MDIRISPGRLCGSIKAVTSKSDVHRALICAAFADRPTEIVCRTLSKDIEATENCLRALGAEIKNDSERGRIAVEPVSLERIRERREAELFCGESGSTLRFLLPAAAALPLRAVFTGAGKLPERPVGALVKELRRHGARISEDRLPIVTEGGLEGGCFELPGNISSQFITGVLLAFPLLKEKSTLKLMTELESSAYVDMTTAVMRSFGVTIEKGGESGDYHMENMPGGYISPGSYEAEGDWSNAAFWVLADYLPGNEIRVTGLSDTSLQSDRAVLRLRGEYERAEGMERTEENAGDSAEKSIITDVSGFPDLVPALGVMAAFHRGRTEIINAARLRIKECDRLHAVAENLRLMGGSVTEKPDGLVIDGKGSLRGGVRVSGYNDHRIVMATAIAASACSEPVIIEGAQAVEKSYPGFFEDFISAGGKADVIKAW